MHVRGVAQRLPGASSGTSDVFTSGTCAEHVLLSYASHRAVVILSQRLEVLQVLPHDGHVLCLSWCDGAGGLAVAVGDTIHVYIPVLRSQLRKVYEQKDVQPSLVSQSRDQDGTSGSDATQSKPVRGDPPLQSSAQTELHPLCLMTPPLPPSGWDSPFGEAGLLAPGAPVPDPTDRIFPYTWELLCKFSVGFSIASLSWRPSGDVILVAGDRLALHQIVRRVEVPCADANDDDLEHEQESAPPLNWGGTSSLADIRARIAAKEQSPEDAADASEPDDDVNDFANVLSWQIETRPLWNQLSSTPVWYCEFAPDGMCFATVGQHDRLVKVWRQQEAIRSDNASGHLQTWRCQYLPHPCSVSHLKFRNREPLPGQSLPQNVLLTVCRENIVRIWVEVRHHGGVSTDARTGSFQVKFDSNPIPVTSTIVRFSVRCVIDMGEDGDGVFDWLEAPLRPDSLAGSVYRTERPSTCVSGARHSTRPRDSSKSIDWLVSVQKSGMACVWRVKGLVGTPMGDATAVLWAKFSLHDPQERPHFRLVSFCNIFISSPASGDAHRNHSRSTEVSYNNANNRQVPGVFAIFVLALHGGISGWTCAATHTTPPKISTLTANACFGHRHTLSSIVSGKQHAHSRDCVATVDESGRAILWTTHGDAAAAAPFADPTFFLKPFGIVNHASVFAWAPAGFLAVTATNHALSGAVLNDFLDSALVDEDDDDDTNDGEQHRVVRMQSSEYERQRVTALPSRMRSESLADVESGIRVHVVPAWCDEDNIARNAVHTPTDATLHAERLHTGSINEAMILKFLPGSNHPSLSPISDLLTFSLWLPEDDPHDDPKFERLSAAQAVHTHPFAILAVAAGGTRLCVWAVHPEVTDDGECVLTTKNCVRADDELFELSEMVTAVTIIPDEVTFTSPLRDSNDSSAPIQPCFVTGHADGSVRYWTLRRGLLRQSLCALDRSSKKRITSVIRCIGSPHSVCFGPVAAVKAAPLGYIAILTEMQSDSSQHEVSVWRVVQPALVSSAACDDIVNLAMVKTFSTSVYIGVSARTSADQPSYVMEWVPQSTGAHALAVADCGGSCVRLLCRALNRSETAHTEERWEYLDVLTFHGTLPAPDKHSSVRAIGFVAPGALVAGRSSELFVSTQWSSLQATGVLTGSESTETPSRYSGSIFDWASDLSAPFVDYHPAVLEEQLIAGQLDAVGRVLAHILRVLRHHRKEIAAADGSRPVDGTLRYVPPVRLHDELLFAHQTSATTTLSTSVPSNASTASSSATITNDDASAPSTLDLLNERSISSSSVAPSATIDEVDDKDSDVEEGFVPRSPIDLVYNIERCSNSCPIPLSSEDALRLAVKLSHATLPGVSGREQMRLLAIVETYGEMSAADTRSSLDDCGMRFLLRLRLVRTLRRGVGLSMAPRVADVEFGCSEYIQRSTSFFDAGQDIRNIPKLTAHDFTWALQTEMENQVLEAALKNVANPCWEDMRAIGVGWWLTNPDVVRQVAEQLAKTHFARRREPDDCAIWYLALGKKQALLSLYRATGNTRVSEFLHHEFSGDSPEAARWRTAATKNSYALMSKQRFGMAVAFFLLSGKLWDACSVCLDKLHDVQLALFIARLVQPPVISTVSRSNGSAANASAASGGFNLMRARTVHPSGYSSSVNAREEAPKSSVFVRLLEEKVLRDTCGYIIDNGERTPQTVAVEQRILTCMCLWSLKRYDDAVCVIGEGDLRGSMSPTRHSHYPSLLHLFCSLSKYHQVRIPDDLKRSIEELLRVRAAEAYFSNGCSVLAVQQLSILLQSRSAAARASPKAEIEQDIREHAALFFGSSRGIEEENERTDDASVHETVPSAVSEPVVFDPFGGGLMGNFGALGSSFGGASAQASNSYDFLNSSATNSTGSNAYDFLDSSVPLANTSTEGHSSLGLSTGMERPAISDMHNIAAADAVVENGGTQTFVDAGMVHALALSFLVSRLTQASEHAGPAAVEQLLFDLPSTDVEDYARSDLSVICSALCLSQRQILGLLHTHFTDERLHAAVIACLVLNSHPTALDALAPAVSELRVDDDGDTSSLHSHGSHSSRRLHARHSRVARPGHKRERLKGVTSRTHLYKKTRSAQAASAFAQQLLSVATCVNLRALTTAQLNSQLHAAIQLWRWDQHTQVLSKIMTSSDQPHRRHHSALDVSCAVDFCLLLCCWRQRRHTALLRFLVGDPIAGVFAQALRPDVGKNGDFTELDTSEKWRDALSAHIMRSRSSSVPTTSKKMVAGLVVTAVDNGPLDERTDAYLNDLWDVLFVAQMFYALKHKVRHFKKRAEARLLERARIGRHGSSGDDRSSSPQYAINEIMKEPHVVAVRRCLGHLGVLLRQYESGVSVLPARVEAAARLNQSGSVVSHEITTSSSHGKSREVSPHADRHRLRRQHSHKHTADRARIGDGPLENVSVVFNSFSTRSARLAVAPGAAALWQLLFSGDVSEDVARLTIDSFVMSPPMDSKMADLATGRLSWQDIITTVCRPDAPLLTVSSQYRQMATVEHCVSRIVFTSPESLEERARLSEAVAQDGHRAMRVVLEPSIIYRDRDILQSFCVNPLDPSQIAIATTKGIREISGFVDHMDELEGVAARHSETNLHNFNSRDSSHASGLHSSSSSSRLFEHHGGDHSPFWQQKRMAVSAAAAISAFGSHGNTPRQMMRDMARAGKHVRGGDVESESEDGMSSDSDSDEFGLWDEADEAESLRVENDVANDRPVLVHSRVSTVVGEIGSTAVSITDASGSVHDAEAVEVVLAPTPSHNMKYSLSGSQLSELQHQQYEAQKRAYNEQLHAPTPTHAMGSMSTLERVKSTLHLSTSSDSLDRESKRSTFDRKNSEGISKIRRDAGSPNTVLSRSNNSADDVRTVDTHPSIIVDHSFLASWLEAHPNLPYYVAGGADGSVQMFHFGVPEDNAALIASFRDAPSPRITRLRFNGAGSKLGAVDMAGRLQLWRLDGMPHSRSPFLEVQAHTKRALDFCWLNSGSFLATAGYSKDHRNVCLWDTLVRPSSSLVHGIKCHDSGGASSVVYSARHQVLVTGGKKGDMHFWDMRNLSQPIHSEPHAHHTHNVKTLSTDSSEDFVVSGSTDGAVKMWSLPDFSLLHTWREVHAKHTFLRRPGPGLFVAPVSTYGVMQVASVDNRIFTCGSDGVLYRFRVQHE